MPWHIVAWRNSGSAEWGCAFFDGAVYGSEERARAEARRFAEEKSNHWQEVRFLDAKMIAAWGPKDTGGAFNSLEVQHEIDYDKGTKT